MAPLLSARREAALRVCFVAEEFPPDPGGLALSAHRIACWLAQAGFEVHVITPDRNRLGSSEKEDGLELHRVECGTNEADLRMNLHRRVKSLHGAIDFDLFHGFFLPAALPCLRPAKSKRRRQSPVIASVRGSDASVLIAHPFMRSLLLQVLREADWITSVNQIYLDLLNEDVVLDGRASVIRNGFPALPRSWSIHAGNEGVVGTCGSMRRVKDIPLLIRGFRGASPVSQRLLLIGEFEDPVEEEWSKTLIAEFGIGDRVEITGRLPHAEALAHLSRMRVYVQTSAFEGMPNAVLEAAAVGVPIVATAVGGIPEVFTHGHDALLAPYGDPFALSRAIRSVQENESLAQQLSTNAAALCVRMSQERERRQWIELHQRLVDGLPPA